MHVPLVPLVNYVSKKFPKVSCAARSNTRFLTVIFSISTSIYYHKNGATRNGERDGKSSIRDFGFVRLAIRI